MSRAGSWPALLVAACVFLALFVLLRSGSTFLAIEAQRDAASALASEHGVSTADALALRDLVGADAPSDRWRDAVVRFVERRDELGEQRAIAELAGDPVAARRFVLLRERFASRH